MGIKHGFVAVCDGCDYDFDEGEPANNICFETEQEAKARVLELDGAVGEKGEVLCADCAEDLPDEADGDERGGQA